MSTTYYPVEPFPISDLIMVVEANDAYSFDETEERPFGHFVVTDGDSFIHFYNGADGWEDYITSADRFGSNDPEMIYSFADWVSEYEEVELDYILESWPSPPRGNPKRQSSLSQYLQSKEQSLA